MKLARFALCLCLLSAAGVSCRGECAGAACGPRPATVTIGAGPTAVTFTVEVASTPAERAQGLMQRKAIPGGTGMLFLFPRPTRAGFWMKSTLVDLDIAFIRGDRVVEVRRMTPCPADPCPLTRPSLDYDKALETGAGGLASVRAGDPVGILGELPTAS